MRVNSRLARVAASISRTAPRSARVGSDSGGTRPDLRALDIGDGGRGGGDFGARKGAESVERRDAEKIAQAPLRRAWLARVARHRRQRNAQVFDEPGKQRLLADRLGRDDFTRLEPGDLGGEPARGRLGKAEGAGRYIRRGEPIDPCPSDRRTRAMASRILARAGSSRRSSVIVPGVTRRTTSRATTRFAAALARLARILDLLADRDAVAEADQTLQIIVGALDRHAAHRNILALMLAALGQHDAERAAGNFGVLEEHFVEIAHPVEQKAVGIGGLDLAILRHHRRDAGALRERFRGLCGTRGSGLGGIVEHGRTLAKRARHARAAGLSSTTADARGNFRVKWRL